MTKSPKETTGKYLCDYQYRGKTWLIELDAYSHEEAQYRLQALSQGKVLGEIGGKITVKNTLTQKIIGKLLSLLGIT